MPPIQIQIVFFAVVAAFVLFQLYNVLGKKVGRQPEEDARAQPPALAGPQDPNAARATVLDAVTLSSIAGLKARPRPRKTAPSPRSASWPSCATG